MEGISITKLLLIAILVILLFSTNKLRILGDDLGITLKSFKKAIRDDKLYGSAPNTKTVEADHDRNE